MIETETRQDASVDDVYRTTVILSPRERYELLRLVGPFGSGKPYRTQSEAVRAALALLIEQSRETEEGV